MKAHLVQLDIQWENTAANREKVAQMLDRAAPTAGDLVLLPEMFDTGFSMNIASTADKDASTLQFLLELAEDYQVIIQGGRTLASCHRCLAANIMSIVGPRNALMCEYQKIHPFSLGKEHEHFEAGREVKTYRWGDLTVAPAICYDLRFPELFREGMKMGAEVFALGACWPQARQHHWRALLVARAIENQAFVLGVNRTGNDPTLQYVGGSIALGPTGEVLGELGPEERVLSVEIDPAIVRRWREKFPAIRDARLLD